MKKIFILLVLGIAVHVNATGVLYTVADSAADSCALGIHPGNSIMRSVIRMAQTSTGDILLMYRSEADRSFRMVYSSNYGSSWGEDTGTFRMALDRNTVGSGSPTLTQIGDSVFCYLTQDGTQTRTVIRKYVGSTIGLLDTMNTYGGSSRASFFAMGGNLYVLNGSQAGTDSLHIYYTNGAFAQASTYTRVAHNAIPVSGYGAGPVLPAMGKAGPGFVIRNIDGDTLYWVDSAYGYDTLSVALCGEDLPAPGVNGGDLRTGMTIVKDSYFVVAWQPATSATLNRTKSRAGHISATGAGAGTIVWDADTVLLTTAGDLKGGWFSQPCYSAVGGTDTVFAYYIVQADTTDTDNVTIMRRLSSNKGQSWGSEVALYTTTNIKVWMLNAPQTIYNVGSYIRPMVAWTDSSAADIGETIYMAIDTIGAGSTPSTPTSNSFVRSSVVRSGVVR